MEEYSKFHSVTTLILEVLLPITFLLVTTCLHAYTYFVKHDPNHSLKLFHQNHPNKHTSAHPVRAYVGNRSTEADSVS